MFRDASLKLISLGQLTSIYLTCKRKQRGLCSRFDGWPYTDRRNMGCGSASRVASCSRLPAGAKRDDQVNAAAIPSRRGMGERTRRPKRSPGRKGLPARHEPVKGRSDAPSSQLVFPPPAPDPTMVPQLPFRVHSALIRRLADREFPRISLLQVLGLGRVRCHHRSFYTRHSLAAGSDRGGRAMSRSERAPVPDVTSDCSVP